MKKTIFTPVFLIFILLTLLTTSFLIIQTKAQSPFGNILIVDVGGEGDFTNIQSAINNANSADTIQIKNGVYNENNIVIDKKINIIGENSEKTIINCNNKPGFILESCCIEISNIKIMNSEEYSINIAGDSNKCEFSDVIITNAKGVGIWVQSSDNKITGCDIKGPGYGVGIKLRESETVTETTAIHGFDTAVLILISSNKHEIKDCVMYNNENAVDIRINSNENQISNCDISYNTQGVHIWQKSKNNLIYLNNFWKNTVNADDETNNSWDNGSIGNYWDDYEGIDNDNDGLGDVSYTVKKDIKDRYPLVKPVSSDIIREPFSLRLVSYLNDNTPTFSWIPSLYSGKINGYIVKIDNKPEEFIGNVTIWTSNSIVNNGIHTFYVKAKASDNTTSDFATTTFLIDTTTNDSDGDGWTDEEEQKYGTDPYDSDNYPLDTDDDHIPDAYDSDDDNDGYSDQMEEAYGTYSKNSKSSPVDTDNDGIPNNDSSNGEYAGDEDDDNDGLDDIIETRLGSNPLNPLDVKRVYIKGEQYFLVDVTQSQAYDLIYDPQSLDTNAVEKKGSNYLIDSNGDDTWDYIYYTNTGEIKTYEQKTDHGILIPFVMFMTLMSILVIRYYLVNIKKDSSAKKDKKTHLKEDKLETVNITKNLLYDMQETVARYVKQLDVVEKEITKAEQKTFSEENIVSVKKTDDEKETWKNSLEPKSYEDVQIEVDSVLFEKMKTKKDSLPDINVNQEVDTLISEHFNT